MAPMSNISRTAMLLWSPVLVSAASSPLDNKAFDKPTPPVNNNPSQTSARKLPILLAFQTHPFNALTPDAGRIVIGLTFRLDSR
ncbi:hypothetical protein HBI71_005300 [Parastagonospora nodorum]|nr:hypothetical protein HBI71_005300 [Parastagonospora nodorum]KAH5414320.1 hypothetical protein HBI47_152900 [Parastagonospora nodorum]